MTITDASVVLTRPGRNYVLVRIETDDGLVGWGDATLNGREKAVEAALEHHLFPELVGRSADRIEDVWQFCYRSTYWRGGPVLNSALSGIDVALWDLKGKRAGLPVYELLGGRTRDRAAAYDHCGAASTDAIVDNCEAALERGFEHLRINLTPDDDTYLDLDRAVDSATAVREALGSDPELILDVHGRADPHEAARLATRLEPVDVYFLEDPIRPENPDALERIRAVSSTPIGVGELYVDPWSAGRLVEENLVDFLRVDLSHVGGITAGRKLAALAERHYVRTAFHGPVDLSPVGLAATVHLDLAIPNFGVQELTEHESVYGDPIADVFSGGAAVVEGAGALDVPDRPGLGIDVDVDAAREFPYEREHLPAVRGDDGAVRDW